LKCSEIDPDRYILSHYGTWSFLRETGRLVGNYSIKEQDYKDSIRIENFFSQIDILNINKDTSIKKCLDTLKKQFYDNFSK
jgi:hypothetical protein